MVDPALVTTVDVERRIVVLGGRWFRVVRRRRDGQVSLSLRELDGEGQGSWRGQACVRVAEGGEARDRIDTGQGTFACALGGADGRTLFAAASSSPGGETFEPRPGRILAVDVDVAGAGSP